MMDRVTHGWWKFGCHRTRKQHAGVPELSPEAAHRRTRLILAAGLGGMILLMLGAGINAVRVLHLIREQSNLIQADAAARTGTLVSIRTKLLLSDSFVRDYLMDPDENRSAEDNSQLRQVWAELEKGLDAYAAATPDTDEAEMAARLRRKDRALLGIDQPEPEMVES